LDKIIAGKLDKFYQDVCLMEQQFIKDQEKTIEQLLNELVAKTGEKIMVRRFVRFQVGEGVED
jgi:elongation factor Ts